MDKCEKCLYKENCQFLAIHKGAIVERCTAFKSEADLRAGMVREIFEEIEKICRDYNRYEIGERGLFARLAELKKKYMEEKK